MSVNFRGMVVCEVLVSFTHTTEVMCVMPLVAAEVGCASLCTTCRSQTASTKNTHLINFIHQRASHCLTLADSAGNEEKHLQKEAHAKISV